MPRAERIRGEEHANQLRVNFCASERHTDVRSATRSYLGGRPVEAFLLRKLTNLRMGVRTPFHVEIE